MRKLDVLRIMCLTLLLASTMRGQTAPGVNNAALHPLQTSLPPEPEPLERNGGVLPPAR